MQYVVFNKNEQLCILTPDFNSGMSLEQIIAKDIPQDCDYKIVTESEFPNDDGTFRDAWELDVNSQYPLQISIDKARDIWRNKIREQRIELFKELDIQFMIAMEQGNVEAQSIIAIKKQRLRDAPVDPRINDAVSIEELKSLDIIMEAMNI